MNLSLIMNFQIEEEISLNTINHIQEIVGTRYPFLKIEDCKIENENNSKYIMIRKSNIKDILDNLSSQFIQNSKSFSNKAPLNLCIKSSNQVLKYEDNKEWKNLTGSLNSSPMYLDQLKSTDIAFSKFKNFTFQGQNTLSFISKQSITEKEIDDNTSNKKGKSIHEEKQLKQNSPIDKNNQKSPNKLVKYNIGSNFIFKE